MLPLFREYERRSPSRDPLQLHSSRPSTLSFAMSAIGRPFTAGPMRSVKASTSNWFGSRGRLWRFGSNLFSFGSLCSSFPKHSPLTSFLDRTADLAAPQLIKSRYELWRWAHDYLLWHPFGPDLDFNLSNTHAGINTLHYNPGLILPASNPQSQPPLVVHQATSPQLDTGLRRALEQFEREFGHWLMITSEEPQYWRMMKSGRKLPRIELMVEDTERLYVWGRGLKSRIMEFEEAKKAYQMAQKARKKEGRRRGAKESHQEALCEIPPHGQLQAYDDELCFEECEDGLGRKATILTITNPSDDDSENEDESTARPTVRVPSEDSNSTSRTSSHMSQRKFRIEGIELYVEIPIPDTDKDNEGDDCYHDDSSDDGNYLSLPAQIRPRSSSKTWAEETARMLGLQLDRPL
jgi:hypothetical protein